MKKFLSLTTAILLLLFVSFWGYIQYQRNASYKTHIHKDVAMLARVDVYDIYKSLLSDYFKIKKRKKESFLGGLGIPANIFVFTLNDKQATTLFTTFPLEDPGELDRSLKQHAAAWEPVEAAAPGVNMKRSPDGKWTIAYNADVLAMAYSPTRENITAALSDLVLKKNTIPVNASRFSGIKEQEGHITFSDGNYKGSINFGQGEIDAQAEIPAKGWHITTKAQHREPAAESALYMWCYILPENLLAHKTFTTGAGALSGDSLLAAGLNGFELEITDPVLQKDSVVTYDYNDDFEKVATVTVKENKVPGMQAFISGDPALLNHYLQQSNMISADSGLVNTALFPLYKLYAGTRESGILLSTRKGNTVAAAGLTSPEIFKLYINFDRLKAQPEFALLQQYVQAFSVLDIRGTCPDGNQIQAKGKLQLKNKSTNALLQLLQIF